MVFTTNFSNSFCSSSPTSSLEFGCCYLDEQRTGEAASSLSETIKIMRHQEDKGYQTLNCLVPAPPMENDFSSTTTAVDADCRFRMAEWCYQIVDYCKFDRQVVEVAMSCLDRFSVASPTLLRDRNRYQLASMTCLYSAIKQMEPEAMPLALMAKLSQGLFTKQQIETMELEMLQAIQWRVHPPTASAFAHYLLKLSGNNQDDQNQVLKLTESQIKTAVSYADFIHVPASAIALASLINAFESTASSYRRANALAEAANHMETIQTYWFWDVRSRLYTSILSATTTTTTTAAASLTKHCIEEGDDDADTLACNKNNATKIARSSYVHGSPRSVSVAPKEV